MPIIDGVDTADFRSFISSFSVPSLQYNYDQGPISRCLQIAIQTYLQRQALKLYSEAERARQPTMTTYMSDGWSTWLQQTHRHQITQDCKVTRKAYARVEYLLERVIHKTIDINGAIHAQITLKAPSCCDDGKIGWDIFAYSVAVLRQFFGTHCLRISILVLLQDGLHNHSFWRRHRARTELYFDLSAEQDTDFSAEDFDPNDQVRPWVFGFRCMSHAGSSACQWGMAQYGSDSMVDEIYIVVQSLINASESLLNHLDILLSRVTYDDDWGCLSQDEYEVLLQSLGVPPLMIDELVRLFLRWDASQNVLYVAKWLELEVDGMELINSALVYCLQWKSFRPTRWCAGGPCGRHFVLSQLVGAHFLAKQVLKTDDPLKEKLHGVTRFSADMFLFLVHLAFMSYPVESFSEELLEDDRFFSRHAELLLDIKAETSYVSNLPIVVWAALVALIQAVFPNDLHHLTAFVLRSTVVQSIYVSLGYLDAYTFALLREYPWRLIVGDINENLQNLVNGPPMERAAYLPARIAIDYATRPGETLRALKLCEDTAATTGLCEKGHKCGAWLKRFHNRMGKVALVSRCLVCDASALFTIPKAERQIQKLDDRIATLHAKSESTRLTARNAFAAFLAKHRGPARTPASGRWQRNMWRQQARLWAGLSDDNRKIFHEDAQRLRAERRISSTQLAAELDVQKRFLQRRFALQKDEKLGMDDIIYIYICKRIFTNNIHHSGKTC
jgi:hypothetical protein